MLRFALLTSEPEEGMWLSQEVVQLGHESHVYAKGIELLWALMCGQTFDFYILDQQIVDLPVAIILRWLRWCGVEKQVAIGNESSRKRRVPVVLISNPAASEMTDDLIKRPVKLRFGEDKITTGTSLSPMAAESMAINPHEVDAWLDRPLFLKRLVPQIGHLIDHANVIQEYKEMVIPERYLRPAVREQ